MKSRLISLALCVLMVISVFLVSCSKDEPDPDAAETAPRTPVSLNLWIITDKKTTPDAQAAVEKAFNDIVKSKFTTNVDIVFLTEDEYYKTLDNKMTEIEERKIFEEEEAKRKKEEERSKKAAGITDPETAPPSTDTTEYVEETVTNKYGMSEIKYPALSDYQVDIVLIKGMDMLLDYTKSQRLTQLDQYLTAEAKQLSKFIYPSFLEQTKINGATYAIPNNHIIGEYTYMLINKDLADKYYFNPANFIRMDDDTTKKFIEDVAENEPEYTPVLSRVENPYINYWSKDGGKSILANYFPAASTLGMRADLRNLFAISQYTSFEVQMQEYEDKGYFSKNPEQDDKFAVAMFKGDARVADEYADDYYVKIVKRPVATEEILFESMFAISAYTRNASRSMEIITMLNTDPELRNLLQYGVENVHYEIDEDDGLVRINNEYIMNLVDTGNVFIAYPEEGMEEDVWEYGKKQNNDSLVSPLVGLGEHWHEVDTKMMDKIATLSAEYFARESACQNAEELVEFYTTAVGEIADNSEFLATLSLDIESKSPNSVYFTKWFNVKWPPESD